MNIIGKPKDIVVWSCAHASPDKSNSRFDWLAKFLYDTKPDIAIDLGDGADMKSLNSFDKAKPANIVSQSYERDIKVYNDSQDRLRHLFRHHKVKRPFWVGIEGNHETRIKTAIQVDPRVEGENYGISFGHLQTDKWFNEYHEYEHGSPAIADYCGVDFSHFFNSGNSGKSMSGVHHAYALIQNRHKSSVCGHSHKRGIYFHDLAGSIGMVVGCYKGGHEEWAGQSQGAWWNGVILMKGTRDGLFEPQFINQSTLEKTYANL